MTENISNLTNKGNEKTNDVAALLNRLQKMLKVEIIEIQAAITAVGAEPARVERYLRDRLGLLPS